MTEYSIRLSSLGRKVCVGDVYNYFVDEIIPFNPEQSRSDWKETKIENELNLESNCFFQLSDNLKYHMLNINSHLAQNIKLELIDVDHLWCRNYLTSNPKEENHDEVQVTFIIRVVKRIETFKSDFLANKMHEYQAFSYGKATHLVEQVVYGAEFIFSIQKSANSSEEKKDKIEESIYLAAQNYFDHLMESINAHETPNDLENVSCTILSSLDGGNVVTGSFQLATKYLKKVIDQKGDFEKWQSIEILLCYIPAQIETRIVLEKYKDVECELQLIKETRNWIHKESRKISSFSSLDQALPYETILCQFRDMLGPLDKVIDDLYAKLLKKHTSPWEVVSSLKPVTMLLFEIRDWLINRSMEISTTCFLLHCPILKMIALEKISDQPPLISRFKVLILKIDYKLDPLLERIQKIINHSGSKLEFPFFPILSGKKKDFDEFKKRLEYFSNEAKLNLNGPNRDIQYHIALVPMSTPKYYDGMVLTIGCKLNQQQLIESSEKIDSHHTDDSFQPSILSFPSSSNQSMFSSTLDGSINKFTMDSQKSTMEQEGEERQTTSFESTIDSNSDTVAQQKSPSDENLLGNSTVQTNEQTSISIVDETAVSFSGTTESISKNSGIDESYSSDFSFQNSRIDRSVDESSQKDTEKSYEADESVNQTEEDNEHNESCNQSIQLQQLVQEVSPCLRIAEIFMDEKYKLCQLMKNGQNEAGVYLLNADEKFVVGNDLRSFDIGQPNNSSHHQHKVIILMGATGCGKSTLINGMINYILGVQWKDPFRFKIIRDDKSDQNQAYSQTSSVTAYTLHHCNGMTVPYSITIIDTPGYGDTRGVKRDKEITQTIHRFLTRPENQIDQIHAVCFVAASGDSRLTQTQRYILDSVLSIFGKDVKENIRLLVTFADNADPPVVDACKAAHFPMTSQSAGITYSKFNSSVLYASNQNMGGDDVSFDELFWDMGQENFDKFFKTLEAMNGCDLTSTREVIRCRQEAEKTFKDIENELEECLLQIENMELFQTKMKQYSHKLEANKNFVIEKTELISIKTPHKNGLVSYNCRRCKKSCEPSENKKKIKKTKEMRKCTQELCPCPGSEHEYQEFEWCKEKVTTQTTLLDRMEEYNLNYDRKMTTEELLINCQLELETAKSKVISLLYKLGENARKLDSTALRSNALSPADYLCLMRSRVNEEKASGYMIRLHTLTELERYLVFNAPAIQTTSSSSLMPYSAHPLVNPIALDFYDTRADNIRRHAYSPQHVMKSGNEQGNYPYVEQMNRHGYDQGVHLGIEVLSSEGETNGYNAATASTSKGKYPKKEPFYNRFTGFFK